MELTQNPTALYRALAHLAKCGAMIPGGEAVSHLFIIGPGALTAREARRRAEGVTRWVEKVRAQARTGRTSAVATSGSILERTAEASAAQPELRREAATSRVREAAPERSATVYLLKAASWLREPSSRRWRSACACYPLART